MIRFAGNNLQKPVALLLLSGGKDSRIALDELIKNGYQVTGLCIDGKQGQEKLGAYQAAHATGTDLIVVNLFFFDETTWNPFKLIIRDLAMGVIAIYYAKKIGAQYLATGVLKSDIENPKLSWLSSFLNFSKWMLNRFGLFLIFPVWEFEKQSLTVTERKAS